MIGEVFRSEWFKNLLADLSDKSSFEAKFGISPENLDEIIQLGKGIYEEYQKKTSKYRFLTIYLTDVLSNNCLEGKPDPEVIMNYVSLICYEMKKEGYKVYYINDKYTQTFFSPNIYIKCEIFIGEKDETKEETINKYALDYVASYIDYEQKNKYNSIVKSLTERSKEL